MAPKLAAGLVHARPGVAGEARPPRSILARRCPYLSRRGGDAAAARARGGRRRLGLGQSPPTDFRASAGPGGPTTSPALEPRPLSRRWGRRHADANRRPRLSPGRRRVVGTLVPTDS